MFTRILKEETGVLTFEWIMMLSVLAAGAGTAVAGVRDALESELFDVAEAIMSLDQSYYISSPWEICTPEGGWWSGGMRSGGWWGGGAVWDGATYSYYHDSMVKPKRISRSAEKARNVTNSEFKNNDFIQTL